MENRTESTRKQIERLAFKHLAEIFIFSGILLLLIVLLIPKFEQKTHVTKIAQSYQGLSSLVKALQIYTVEHPNNDRFPPDPELLFPGIILCPIRSNTPANLAFLTSPVSFIEQPPIDPFMSAVDERKRDLTPIVLHWVKTSKEIEQYPNGYSHIAWGALSVGPSLELPPQYDITVLRRVPYESWPLRANLFDPSNGMESIGIIYKDNLGNTTKL